MSLSEKNNFSFKNLGILFPALVTSFLWGSAVPAVKLSYEFLNISPTDTYGKLLFAGIRFTGAGILVLLFAFLIGVKNIKPTKAQWPGLLLLALMQTTICYYFYYVGLANTSGVRGSVLMGTTSLFSVLFAHFFCKNEHMNFQKLFGSIIGFSGIVLMAGDGLTGRFSLAGDGFLLLSASCSGIAFCISRNISSQSSPLQISGIQLTVGGLILVIISLLGSPSFSVTAAGMFLLFYLMFLSAAALAIWTSLLKYNPVGKVALYNFLVPIFGTILSGILLGEFFLSFRFLMALLLVCIGIAIVNYTMPGKKTALEK